MNTAQSCTTDQPPDTNQQHKMETETIPPEPEPLNCDKNTEGNGITASDKQTDSEEVELTPVVKDI